MNSDVTLLMTPGVIEYEQGYAAGWAAGREELMRQLADRRDCADATWQAITRPSWEEHVARRIAEMEDAARGLPEHLAACQRINEERDKAVIENAPRRTFDLGALLPGPQPAAPPQVYPALHLVRDAPDRGPAA